MYNMGMEVRVRLAPSPTGSPHIGTAWQALFDFVFAQKESGKFILRLEDTDRERYVPESIDQIFETLKWLGLNWDEGPDIGGPKGPYVQSERLNIYKKFSAELLNKNLAYKEDGAIKFTTEKEGSTSWHDLIGGKEISFQSNTQEDFVIIKSDGYPTYNFANVVDDHLMEISHVIRGNEFISSTPKHLMLYSAFGWQPPQFVHLPVLVGSDRAKLSKRHGAKGALEFKEEGYLQEAILNFLALLGWSHPEGKEIFSLDEMIKVFDFKDFNQASAYFDVTKLNWLNGAYIRKISNEELTKRLQDFLVDHPAKEKIAPVVPLIKERIKKLSDFIPLCDFLFEKPEFDRAVFDKLTIKNPKEVLEKIAGEMEKMKKPWKTDLFENIFRDLAKEMGVKDGDLFQLIRVAVSGQLVTPPLFESIKILGEEEVVTRVKAALQFI